MSGHKHTYMSNEQLGFMPIYVGHRKNYIGHRNCPMRTKNPRHANTRRGFFTILKIGGYQNLTSTRNTLAGAAAQSCMAWKAPSGSAMWLINWSAGHTPWRM